MNRNPRLTTYAKPVVSVARRIYVCDNCARLVRQESEGNWVHTTTGSRMCAR